MPTTFLRILRAVSLIEGVSYLLLLLVAMPMKYLGDLPWAVSVVGMAHGLLFIMLWLLVAAAWAKGLPTRLAAWTLVASILPAGPFFMDGKLKRYSIESASSAAMADGTER